MRAPVTSARVLAGFALAVLALALAAWTGWRRQQRLLSAQVDRLVRAAQAQAAAEPLAADGATVPAPVERYLRRALPRDLQIRLVRIGQRGALRTDTASDRWLRFEARHTVAPPATGYVWNARVEVAPLLHVRVCDALFEGRGAGQVSLLSAFTVSSDSGTPEMNAGSLHRYLAEAVWYPVALLPSAKLRWSTIDASRALATLSDHGVSVSLEFRFAESGDVAGIYTPARWGRFEGGYRQVPWEGRFRDYRQRAGIRVPGEGEVGWYSGGEWRAVWRGEITSFAIDGEPAR